MDIKLPEKLQDLVVQGGEEFKLSVASPEEIDSLAANIPGKNDRYILRDWTVVKIEALNSAMYLMLGFTEDNQTFCTSVINGLDRKNSRIVTNNNYYGIEKQCEGEPDIELMLRLAHTLRSWGIEERFDCRVKFLEVLY